MSEDISVLGIAVETRGVKEGSDALDRLALSGAGAEKATALLATETKKTSSVIAGLAKDYQSAGDSISDALKKLRIRDSSAIAKEANEIRNALNQIKATGSLDDITRASIAAKSAMSSLRTEFDGIARMPKLNPIPDLAPHIAGMNKLGMSANATAAALRNVPAQFTDIVTSLQGGQSPLTVLLQQGGQLKDMFGGVGNAAKAIGGYALGLVNPFTVAAGAAAALGVAYYQGSGEAQAFATSLILSGNAAGTTSGQLMDMAKTISSSTGATRGAVAETLNAIASSGKVSADVLAQVGKAAIDMERSGGQAASDTVKEFEALGASPVSAILKLNEKYHFLTASVYEQVKALQDQGRETDAAKLAQDSYASAIESRVPMLVQNLGLLERGWKSVKDGAKGAWDAMAGIGRDDSLNAQLEAVTTKIASYKSMGFGSSGTVWDKVFSVPDLENQQRVIQAMIEGERSVTAQVAAQNKAREAGLAWSQESTKYADQQAKKQAEILRVTTMMTEAGKSQAEIAKVLTQVEEKYAEKKGASARAVKEDFTELFQRAEQMKAIYAALGVEFKEIEKQNDDYAKSIAALIDPVEKEAASLERQAETYGLTREQIEQTTIARLEEAKAMAAMNGASEDAIAYYEREIDARKRIAAASASIESRKATDDAAKHAAEEWKKTADKIGDNITDALMRGFESGKGFAQTLKDTVDNMFKTLILKPTIQATVMGGMSALGMGSSSALAGTASSVSSLGNIASLGQSAWGAYTGGIGSAYGAAASSGIGSALGLSTQMAAGYMAPVYGAGGTLLSAGTSTAAGGLTAAGSTIGMAIPYIGLAIAAATAIASMMGKGGGPKTEGNYFGVLNGAGSSTAQQYSTWGNHGTGYSGDSADGQLAQMAPSLTKAITGLIGSLGGSSAGVGINYGYNTDPQGTSQDQVSAAVSDSAGNIVYGNHISVEKGKASDALALEVQRMTLASVKAAEGIKPIFKEVIAGIDLATASAETLSQAIADVQGIVGLRTAFDTLNLGADNLSMSLINSAGGVSTLTSELSSYYDNYFTAAEKNAKSSEAMAKSFSALGMAMPESKEAFRAVVEGLDLTTASGQATFSAMMAMSSTFATVADAAAAANGAIANTAAALAKLAETRASLTASFTAPTTLEQATATVQASGLIDITGMDAEAIRSAMRAVVSTASQSTLDAISGILPAFDQVIQGTIDAATAAAEQQAAILSERAGLQDQIDSLTMTTAQSREKELSALDSSNRSLQERIYALNDEAAAMAARKTADDSQRSIANTGVDSSEVAKREVERLTAVFNAAESAKREAIKGTFRFTPSAAKSAPTSVASAQSLSRFLDPTLSFDQDLIASLAELTSALATVEAAANAAADAVASERLGLQNQIDTLTMTTAQSRAKELSALDSSNRALQERIYALNDEATASAAAKAASEAVSNERIGLQEKIDALVMTTEQSRAKELDALDSSNRALQVRINALTDEAAASAAAKAASEAVSNERIGLQNQLDSLVMTTEQSREKELSALDSSNRAIQQRIYALNDEATAAAAAKAASEATASERLGLQNQIDALVMTTTQSRAKELGALDSSNRALQERIYALNDEATASAAAKAAAESIASERLGLQNQLDSLVMTTAQSRDKELAALDSSNRSLQERIYALNDEATAIAALKTAQESLRGISYVGMDTSEVAKREAARLTAAFNTAFSGSAPANLAAAQKLAAALDPSVAANQTLIASLAELATALSTVETAAKASTISATESQRSLSYLGVDSAEVTKREAARLAASFGAAFSVEAPTTLAAAQAMAAALDPSVEGSQAMIASLLELSSALNTIESAANAAAAAALKAIADERSWLQSQLVQAQGNTVAIRAKELAALDASNRALQTQIWLLEDQKTASEAAKAAAEAAAAKVKAIADERAGLETQLWQAQGNTVSIRAKELAALDASNRAIQEQIWALEDQKTALESLKTNANDAYSALERAVAAQRKIAQTSVDAAQEQVASLKSIFDNLKSGVATLYSEVESSAAMSATDGQKFIADALASGRAPDQEALADAISAAMAGVTDTVYSSQVDADIARLVLAGQMDQLKTASGSQLSIAELSLKAAQDQLTAFDTMLTDQKALLDAALGIDVSVMSVADALTKLSESISAIAASSAATTAASVVSSSAVPGFASGGSFSGGLRLVGENGPELEVTGPSRIFNADQTRNMMRPAANDDGVIAELKLLKAEMVEVRKQLDIANAHASRTAKATNGNPDQPVLVEIAA